MCTTFLSSEEGDFTTVVINIMIRSINKIDDYHMVSEAAGRIGPRNE